MERISKKGALVNRSALKSKSRKGTTNIKTTNQDSKDARKKSMNPRIPSRTTTMNSKSTAHFISLTGSDRNKLEFPVKINRRNKIIREKLRHLFIETVKYYSGVPYK